MSLKSMEICMTTKIVDFVLKYMGKMVGAGAGAGAGGGILRSW
jgi:hypothetical protein